MRAILIFVFALGCGSVPSAEAPLDEIDAGCAAIPATASTSITEQIPAMTVDAGCGGDK